MRTILLLLSLAVLFLSTYEVGVQPAMPLLLNTILPTQTGELITVPAGGDLQSAINRAQPGDTITLPAGATFTAPDGGFVLTPKTGDGWIIIRTANLSGIPAAESRVAPLHSVSMPRIISPGVSPAISTALGASRYRLIGLEITTASSFSYGLVALGSDATITPAAREITLDRCYIHGSPAKETRRGVAINGASLAVVDSYISDIHQSGNDSQAIAGWNGPGPFKIVNSYLEAAGENVLFGGGDPASADMSPADIEVRGNYLRKPTEWLGAGWSVKNLFELKDARRVLVTDNVLEGNWVNGQSGMSVLFTPRNQNGNAPWTQVCDVTFARNTLRAGAGGLNILGHDDLAPSGRTERIRVEGNRFEDIGRTELGGNARLIQLLDGPAYLTFSGNTFLHADGVEGHALIIAGSPVEGFVFQGNTIHGYGIFGDNYGVGAAAVAQYLPGAVFGGNVWLAASWCPAGDSLTSAPTPTPTPTPGPTPTPAPTPTATPAPTPTPRQMPPGQCKKITGCR